RIGELVMAELRRLDRVAYVRFASVYQGFDDVDAFTAMVDEMRQTRRDEEAEGAADASDTTTRPDSDRPAS
ncbi:MAG: hypothetical protein AB7E55_29180, partial [Pigmentiphaga sp.]